MTISAKAVKEAADIVAEEMLRQEDIESVDMYLARRAARRILDHQAREQAARIKRAIAIIDRDIEALANLDPWELKTALTSEPSEPDPSA